jgi:hypothetical protein
MTGIGVQIQFVDSLEIGNTLPRFVSERMAAIKRMQHDAFKKVAEGHVVVLSQTLENLEQPFFQTHSGLHSLDDYPVD